METPVEVLPPAPPIQVLLVEDSPSDAFLLSEALAALGPARCAVTRVARLSDAAERCREMPFDVALLDLGLPDGSGLDTLVRLRATAPDLPIVVLTGNEDEDLPIRALQSGAQDYVTKRSFDGPSIVRTIRYAIERRRADEVLRASEEQYRLFFECSPQPMWAVDRDTFRFLAVNEAALKQYGYTREEFLRMHTLDIRFPGDRERDDADGARLGKDLPPGPGGPFPHRRKDGTRIWVEASSRAFLLRGRPAWLTTVRDVTEHVASEVERRRTERRFRALFESRIIATLVVDARGRIVDANEFFLAMIGATLEELRGGTLSWQAITPPEYRTLDEAAMDRLRAEGHAPPWEKEFLCADGGRVPVLLGATLLENEERTVIAYAVDLTEEKRLEERFRQSQKMEAVGKLAAGVAHDFNNVLTVVDGYAKLLLERLPPADPASEMAREILDAGERAASLTQRLLAFSRRQVLEPRLLDLNAVIADLQKMLVRIIGEDVELVLRLDPALARVKADPGQLEQVLLNLAVNARDAMPRGGRLTIATANARLPEEAAVALELAPGEYAQLSVSDTGVGMDAATRAHLFEPFFTTKAPGKGTGLGLAMVYGVVKQSGGHVTVESFPEAGATFRILLPRALGEREDDAGADAMPAPDARARETVLVVEDDPAVRRLARSILESHGYVVLTAADPEAALEFAQRQPGRIDVLVSDVLLPRMSGPELGERVKALRPGLRVLYMSGHPERAAWALGGEDFLRKPFTPEALARGVRGLLV